MVEEKKKFFHDISKMELYGLGVIKDIVLKNNRMYIHDQDHDLLIMFEKDDRDEFVEIKRLSLDSDFIFALSENGDYIALHTYEDDNQLYIIDAKSLTIKYKIERTTYNELGDVPQDIVTDYSGNLLSHQLLKWISPETFLIFGNSSFAVEWDARHGVWTTKYEHEDEVRVVSINKDLTRMAAIFSSHPSELIIFDVTGCFVPDDVNMNEAIQLAVIKVEPEYVRDVKFADGDNDLIIIHCIEVTWVIKGGVLLHEIGKGEDEFACEHIFFLKGNTHFVHSSNLHFACVDLKSEKMAVTPACVDEYKPRTATVGAGALSPRGDYIVFASKEDPGAVLLFVELCDYNQIAREINVLHNALKGAIPEIVESTIIDFLKEMIPLAAPSTVVTKKKRF